MEQNRKPDWKHWNACETLKVWEAVALSIDRDPNALGMSRDPKNLESDAYVRRLAKAAGIADRDMRFFILGEDFRNRMELVKRAIAVRGADLLAFPKDPYIGFKEAHELEVRPNAVRHFFVDKGLSVPAEWAATKSTRPIATESVQPTKNVDAEPKWANRARQIRDQILRENPKKRGQKFLAGRISEQLRVERVFGRSNRPVAIGTIIRHALRGLK